MRSNGHGSKSWCRPHTRLDRPSRGHCRVTFDHPPVNAVTATIVAELAELVGLIEHDPDLEVVVFASANPGFYLDRLDGEPDGGGAWLDVLARLSRVPAVSIAAIRGRARGDFVLACDLRFASRENTRLLLAAGDLDGPRAERLGYVNRLIADGRLDGEVDAMASRLAGGGNDGAESVTRARLRTPGSAAPRAGPYGS